MLSYLPKRLCPLGQTFQLNLKNEVHQWTSSRVRESFLSFFKERDHVFIPSSPVVPWNDSSIGFVNAGMNQFKSAILGLRDFPAHRAANSQKCVRVGGKHNDLSDVGRDTYHHTFFEMLGNWSFNNYFKEEACKLSWELLTNVYKIPHQHLYVTYFGGDQQLGIEADEEVKNIWLSIGIPEEKILPFGTKDNFWEMGDIGPCGVSTEIHFERNPSSEGSCKVNKSSEDLIEIWNLVFIQYQRLASGKIVPLKNYFVDTGMGLERITACLNGKRSNYDTDLFIPLFQEIEKLSGMPSYKGDFNVNNDCLDTYYRILSDHSRMVAFALADGLLPFDSIVLKKIIRRCLLIGWEKFGLLEKPNFMDSLLRVITDTLGDVYPELERNFCKSKNLLEFEEQMFRESRRKLSKEWPKLVERYPPLSAMNNISPNLARALEEFLLPNMKHWTTKFPMEVAIKLVDDYALPETTIEEIVDTLGLSLDMDQFHSHLVEKRRSAKPVSTEHLNHKKLISLLKENNIPETIDMRYNYKYTPEGGYSYPHLNSHIQTVISDYSSLGKLTKGQSATLLLRSTIFHPDSGGQTCDTGFIECNSNRFKVSQVDILKGYVLHYGEVVEGEFHTGMEVQMDIDKGPRVGASRLHTAHHLFRGAVEAVAGMAYQRSTKVTAKDLRMKIFTHPPINIDHVIHAENIVKYWIKQTKDVSRMSLHLFNALRLPELTVVSGEIYPDDVYVVSSECELPPELQISNSHYGPVTKVKSSELCCGTHFFNTGHLKDFSITELEFQGDGIWIAAVCAKEAQKLNSHGKFVMEEFKKWEQKIVSALEKNEILKYLYKNFKKWKTSIKKSSIPATTFHVIDERGKELLDKMKEIVEPKSNWKELHEEFVAHVQANSVGPIYYDMKTDYRGPVENLVIIMEELTGRPGVFVCKGWGRVRACIYIPQEQQTENVNIPSILGAIQSAFQEDQVGVKSFSNEIGAVHLDGVKRDKIDACKTIIFKNCKEYVSRLIL